jgi:hypothetical protein
VWPAVAVITIAAVIAILSAREPSGTLAVGPRPAAVASETAAPPVDQADFVPEPLDPAETTSERGDGPLLPDAPDLTVVTTDELGMRTIDIATGDIVTEQPGSPIPLGTDPWTLFTVGGRIIANDGGDVVQVAGDLTRTRVARRHQALPTADDASIWMLDNRAVNAPTVVHLRLDGTIADRVDLPAVAYPLIGTADGVLVQSPGGIHLASDTGVRQITDSGQLIAASAEQLARVDCTADLSCEIVAGTFDDPDRLRIPVDRRDRPADFAPATLSVSPDGRLLAAPVARQNSSTFTITDEAVLIIDMAAGAVIDRIDMAGSGGYGRIPLAWSPDGRWLFLAFDGLHAWNAATGETTHIDDHTRPIQGLTVLGP